MQNMSRTVLIIDGDVIAYRAAAAIETRTIKAVHKSSAWTKAFDNRSALKEFLESKEKEYIPEDWEIEDIQTSEEPIAAYGIMKRQIEGFKSSLFADSVEVFISGKNNFRDTLPLPQQYKGNRNHMLRPLHLRNCKKFLLENYKARVSDGMEADDYVIIRGYEVLASKDMPIIVTVDKDANAYSGLNLYDFTKEKPEVKAVPTLGSLWDTGKKITGDGFMFFCLQMLTGDPVDHYKPTFLTNKKYGEKSAYNDLKGCKTEKEALQKVLDKYKEWYPEKFEYTAWNGEVIKSDYLHMFDLYFKCVHMKCSMDDPLDSKEFLKRFKINLKKTKESK
jgi:hypothetical protein